MIARTIAAARRLAGFAGASLRYRSASLRGRPRRYAIHPGYRHRHETRYMDDTGNADLWQREVYEAARDLMRAEGLRTVHDIGCGSGYKLVSLLGEFETAGVDLPATIERVRAAYPDRRWIAGGFEEVALEPAEVVVCSDVIEHVADPDALMRFLARASGKWVILSTPDRDLVYGKTDKRRFGPPANPAHLREWSAGEFAAYVSQSLDIERHEITNRTQCTQMIVARTRS